MAIVGATATGKTSLGVEIARRFNGEIVNADSRLFYRGMDIGTAKPDVSERRGVNHHLVDILEPHEGYSLSDFLRAANRVIAVIHECEKVPVLVGGSGQYVWGLLEGWEVPEIPPNPALRQELERELAEGGIERLQSRLRTTGAANIDKVEILNPRRLVRAIERAVATGDAMGGAGKRAIPPYEALVIGLKAPRDVLHARVADRVDRMLGAGWLKEVQELLDVGIEPGMPSMSAIGYRQLADFLGGNRSWEATRDEIIIGNNRLIGAQHNWFKPRDSRISWIDITDPNYLEAVAVMVDEWLRRPTDASFTG